MKRLCLLLIGAAACAGTGIDTPAAGYALAANGTLVRLSGIAGAFVPNATEITGALACGFSARLGFVKMRESVQVLNAKGELISETDAPTGAALFGFNLEGDAGVAFYPETAALNLFAADEWRTVPFVPRGGIIAVRVDDSDHVSVVVGGDRPALVSIRIADGAIESDQPLENLRGAVLLVAGGALLYGSERGLLYRGPDGVEQLVTEADDILTLQHMGLGWVQVARRSGRNLAVRLGPEVRVYSIPEVAE